METKTCNKCLKTKPVSEFYKRTDLKNGVGYRAYCKKCHLSKNKQTTKEWRRKNKSHRNAYMNERRKESGFRILENLRRRTLYALKNNTKSKTTLELIGCSIDYLKEHLQRTAIDNGYVDFDIENFSGEDYHVDHIRPCDSFDLSDPKEQSLCFHYTNLQILTSDENLAKSASFTPI